jgi:hypothetical protein
VFGPLPRGVAAAAEPPSADKMVAFVRSERCSYELLKPRLEAAIRLLAAEKTTTRVTVSGLEDT